MSAKKDVRYYLTDRPRSGYRIFEHLLQGRLGDVHEVFRRMSGYARQAGCKLVLVDKIDAYGALKDEIECLAPNVVCEKLRRVTFWSSVPSEIPIDDDGWGFVSRSVFEDKSSSDLIGYAILKCDRLSGESEAYWHVFEGVFRPLTYYATAEACTVERPITFDLPVPDENDNPEGERPQNHLCATGIPFCQSSRFVKSCSHAALRNASLAIGGSDEGLLFSEILSDIGWQYNDGKSLAPKGLRIAQIRQILLSRHDAPGALRGPIEHRIYTKECRSEFAEIVQFSIDCGYPVLLAFKLGGDSEAEPPVDDGHVIMCYGYTHNKNAWLPFAEQEYSIRDNQYGAITASRRSSAFISSFIVNDANYGVCLAVPRDFLRDDRLKAIVCFSGDYGIFSAADSKVCVEIIVKKLKELQRNIPTPPPSKRHTFAFEWIDRFCFEAFEELASGKPQIVLRPYIVSKEGYADHIAATTGWFDERRSENGSPIGVIERESQDAILKLTSFDSPASLRVVEFSIRGLYGSNLRKVGEAVFDPDRPITPDSLLWIRGPGGYLAREGRSFVFHPSELFSHVLVRGCPAIADIEPTGAPIQGYA